MSSPLFVMPRTPQNWGGAAALWVTVAGWMEAEARRGGSPRGVLTPGGLIGLEDCFAATTVAHAGPSSTRSLAHRVPQVVRQAGRDAQRAATMTRYSRSAVDLVLAGEAPSGYVWQHHELFHNAGRRVARALDIPLIEYVHAPIVFEARRWGVTRRGTGLLLERLGERPQLGDADLVACVSEEVRDELQRFGVGEERTIVAPMGVDAQRFDPAVDGSAWTAAVRRGDEFVVMWTGSLRRFHHVDLVIHAVRELRDRGCSIRLVIAGDGQDRERLVAVATEAGVGDAVEFLGQVGASEMPALLSCADAAVVTAGANQDFHYSPLKLREYLAMALPVVAPEIGDVGRLLDHGSSGLLYEPGDSTGLADELERLVRDADLRSELGRAGRDRVLESWTWEQITARCLERLEE